MEVVYITIANKFLIFCESNSHKIFIRNFRYPRVTEFDASPWHLWNHGYGRGPMDYVERSRRYFSYMIRNRDIFFKSAKVE